MSTLLSFFNRSPEKPDYDPKVVPKLDRLDLTYITNRIISKWWPSWCGPFSIESIPPLCVFFWWYVCRLNSCMSLIVPIEIPFHYITQYPALYGVIERWRKTERTTWKKWACIWTIDTQVPTVAIICCRCCIYSVIMIATPPSCT